MNPHSRVHAHDCAISGTVVVLSVLALLSIAPVEISAQAAAIPDVVGHWRFDEGSGTTAADSTGTYPGTLVNGTTWTAGRHGLGVNLDGADDYVALPTFDVPGAALTITAWVNHSSFPFFSDQRILSKAVNSTEQGHYWMLSGAGRRLRFRIKSGGSTTTLIASSGMLPLGQWYHAAATYDGARMRLYLNGVEVGSTAKTGAIATSAAVPVNIGRNPDGSNYLHGLIDDVRIYSRALTPAEILSVLENADGASDTTPPSTPASVTASTVSTTAINLGWAASTDNVGVVGYRVFRNGTLIATTAGTSRLDSGLTPSTTYQYTVSAYDLAGNESPPSAPVSATTASMDTVPPVITGIVATGVTVNGATINWTTNEPATGRVEYGTSTAYGSATPTSGMLTSHSHTLANLQAATTYHYRVVSQDGSGNAASSGDFTVTTLAPPPGGIPGVVAHWRFDEGSGTSALDSAGAYPGTLMNGTTWTAGRHGMGVNLDGVNDYVALPSFDIPGSALTITGWVNHSTFPSSSDQRILSKATDSTEQGHYWMLSETGRQLRFRLKAGGSTTTLVAPGQLPIGLWYHAAATYDGATMRLYLNGVEVVQTSKTGAIATNAAVPVNVGRNPDGSNHLHGLLDDVRIYGRALTPAEIQSVLNNEGPSEPPPNQPPAVSLTSPSNGAAFTAPATITLTAAASDPEGDLDRVDFYSGSTLLNSDASAPYSFTWSAVPAGTYVFTAVARDGAGASATSTAASVTVSSDPPLQTTWRVAFTASTNHDSSVTNYLVKVFSSSADPFADLPLATSDLGKPVPDANGEVIVDRTAFFGALPVANYLVTVTAIGPGGSATSNVFAFTR